MFEKPFYNFLYSLILVLITAFFCSYFTRIGLSEFYDDIKVSTLNPPNYVFPIVWTILYAVLVISFDLVLNHFEKSRIRPAAQIFTLNLFLQVLWTFAFFYNAYFMIGFAIIVVLDFVTVYMIKIFYSIHKISGLMLIPYLIWLLFATYLNWMVMDLNGISYNF